MPVSQGGDGPYDEYEQRVRRYRRRDVLSAVARVNSQLDKIQHTDSPPLDLPNYVQPFGLAGVARTALVAGNDHRNTTLTHEALVDLCRRHANVHDPAIDLESDDPAQLRSILNHLAYEQFDHQYSPMENISRTLALLGDHSTGQRHAPTAEQWESALGVSIDGFMRLGFAVFVAALQNEGRINREVLAAPHVAPIFTPLTAPAAIRLIDRWFAATPEELRDVGRAAQVTGYEKWSFNPLLDHPVVSLPGDQFLMPWPALISRRITPTGLYHIGLDSFGPNFPNGLGAMFEDYIGSQLRLLRHATVEPEIVFGKNNERTVDFFVLTPEAVVLVEVKASRPIWATRLGAAVGDEDTAAKIGKAYRQIDTTNAMIRAEHPAVAEIPSDRPIYGMVVTLEPFYLVNTAFWDDLFDRPTIPTVVVSAHELESAVAVLASRRDVGSRLRNVFEPTAGHVISLNTATGGLDSPPNPILASAWDRFSEPWTILGSAGR